MQFAQPLWLLAGFIACALLVWQYRRYDAAQSSALSQFAAARLLGRLVTSVSSGRRLLKRVLFTAGIAFLFVALARPQAGYEWQETHRKGLEILFAVDTSKSMLAQDVKPDRLTRAKMSVTDLVSKLNGDGVGLIAFAGDAFLQCPVTLDYDAFGESLNALDVNIIPRGGTDIASAIHEAEAVFKTRNAAQKILVLVTDGEDLGGEAVQAAEAAAKNGVKIFTVGVGSTQGELIPMPAQNGGTEFAKDENGQLVKSHLDETTLKKIAEATGGLYVPLGTHGEGLATIYQKGFASFIRGDLSSRQAKVPLEQFYWALLAALVCLIAEMLIGNRSRTRDSASPMRAAKVATALAALMVLVAIPAIHAATPQQAEEAYHKGDYARSEKDYAENATKSPDHASLQFNAGTAAYKAGDFPQAAAAFQESLKTGQVQLQQSSYYNLGDTQYRLGQKTATTQPEETIKTWEKAVKSYDAALQINTDDHEAKMNRDFVQRKIDLLKKQQQQKKQDQQQQKQDQKNQSKDQKQDQQNQQQSKDQKGGSSGASQPQNSKDQKGEKGDDKSPSQQPPQDSKGQKQEPKNSQDQQNSAANQPKNDKSKESKSPKDQQAKAGEHDQQNKQDEKTGAQDHSLQAESGKKPDSKNAAHEAPKPVNAAPKPNQAQAEPAHQEKPADKTAANEPQEPREPGQMTREEARQLLDSMKGEESRAPMISARGRAADQPNDHKVLKDW